MAFGILNTVAGRLFRRQLITLARRSNRLRVRAVAAYVGYLQARNLGDEAIYAGIRELFPRYRFRAFDTRRESPEGHRRAERRRPAPDVVFLGGGTLVPWPRYLHELQLTSDDAAVVVFGTGALDAGFWQEHRPELFSPHNLSLWKSALERARYVGVRDAQTASFISRHAQVPCDVIGDPALTLGLPSRRVPRKHLVVGVNVGSQDPIWGAKEKLISEVETALSVLTSRGAVLEFVALHPADVAFFRQLKTRPMMERLRLYRAFAKGTRAISRFGYYDLMIGQRLHATILASAFGVPTIALAYNPKCTDFMAAIGRSDCSIRTDVVTATKILDRVDAIMCAYTQYRDEINERCEHLRRVQCDAAKRAEAAVSG